MTPRRLSIGVILFYTLYGFAIGFIVGWILT